MMSQKEGKREIIYQMTMSAARQMLEKGLISEEEYKQFDTKMQQNLALYSALYSRILTCNSAVTTVISPYREVV